MDPRTYSGRLRFADRLTDPDIRQGIQELALFRGSLGGREASWVSRGVISSVSARVRA